MITSILIANRGEIASRIIRTCRKMGIKSIAVYAEADRQACFVGEADIAVFIGPSIPSASYLDEDKIIATAKKTGASAIHPGYGFLSERAGFAKRCEQEGIVFIGPNPKAIEAMGSKSNAKELMQKHDVPVVPGYSGTDQSVETLSKAAKEIGFPVLLKATAGGGGKGMRIVEKKSELEAAITAAKRESKSAFGDDELIVEKYVANARHIEFQIFGDQHGNVIHLLERECSIQRRYQKVIEESPSPIMDDDLRAKMAAAAVNAAKALAYDNAGTVEFIYDGSTGDFYFLEVNTRLQVEHPVTEEITGLDLVAMQIESAQGDPLSIGQADVKGKGYALEVRLYAEDASNDFHPVTGTIQRFECPKVQGLRVESAIESGSEISVFYDPMIAKLIVWDEKRANAHLKMKYVLRNLICQGMVTNQDFLLHLLNHPDFLKGNYDTHFIQKKMDLNLLSQPTAKDHDLAAITAVISVWHKREKSRKLLQSVPSGWRNSFYTHQQKAFKTKNGDEIVAKYRFDQGQFSFQMEKENYNVKIIEVSEQNIRLEIDDMQYLFNLARDGADFFIHHESFGNIILSLQERFPEKENEKIKGGYETPMPSQIIKILVEEGQQVETGDPLVVISSMKMETTISADKAGQVEAVFAKEGENVEAGFLLLKLKELVG